MARLSRRLWGGMSLKTAAKEAILAIDENKAKYFGLGRPCEKMLLAANQHFPSIRCESPHATPMRYDHC